ncbi:MAG: hypothetical protein K0Q92_3269 [Steroidobacteraceae bacterium]|nr:hypothetical protein [Steroidobacteraceae bacterium]
MNAVSQLAPAAVVVRRTIAASAHDLFDAWLDAEALAEWMRPGTIQRSQARVDPRVGGEYEVIMQGEKGAIPHRGIFGRAHRSRRDARAIARGRNRLAHAWLDQRSRTSRPGLSGRKDLMALPAKPLRKIA